MTTYKHLTKLAFKGLTYKYNKTLGEWRLLDKGTLIRMPAKIYEVDLPGQEKCWTADNYTADTPEGVLEAYVLGHIRMRKRDLAIALAGVALAKDSLRAAKSKTLTFT